MATLKEIKELALHAAKGTAPSTYSVESVNAALLDQMKEIAGSINKFMKNRYDIYEIITETVDEVVPKTVADALSIFAEIQIGGQGQRSKFVQKTGKLRAKKFLTQVGLSGVYETFRLDKTTYDISVGAIGGAATIDFERFLDGAETMADLMAIIVEGLSDAIFIQVQRALVAAASASNRPNANLVSESSFSAAHLFTL